MYATHAYVKLHCSCCIVPLQNIKEDEVTLVTVKIRLLCYFHSLQHSGRSAHWFITQRTCVCQ